MGILIEGKKDMEAIKSSEKIYNIRIKSLFVLTPSEVKKKLGSGFKVVEVGVEKDSVLPEINSTTTAMDAIIKAGYRSLARAYHPDLGGDPEVMVILNRTKKELEALLKEIA